MTLTAFWDLVRVADDEIAKLYAFRSIIQYHSLGVREGGKLVDKERLSFFFPRDTD